MTRQMCSANLRLHAKVKSSEEEESEGEGSVSNSCVVATGREEETHDETENHPDVLVHAEQQNATMSHLDRVVLMFMMVVVR